MSRPEFWVDWRDDGVKITGWVYEVGKPRGTRPLFWIEGNDPSVGGGFRTSWIYRRPQHGSPAGPISTEEIPNKE